MNKYNILNNYSYSLGTSLTIEALKCRPKEIKEIILSNKINSHNQSSLLFELINKNNISTRYDDKLINNISVKDNCYCIGIINKYKTKINNKEHLILYDFTDLGELGTVIRSAVSFDFKDIVLISDIDYFDPRVIRSSMGSIFHINIERFDNIYEYFSRYKNRNIYPFLSKGNIELSDIKLNYPYSIIISEDYYVLDKLFNKGYYIKYKDDIEISLSIRSAIILNSLFYLKRNL